MPRIYRVMASEQEKPKVGSGSSMLGARNRDFGKDNSNEKDFSIEPNDGGISVGGCLRTLYVPMLPRRLQYVDPERFRGAKGKDDHQVWAMGDGDYESGSISPDLKLRFVPNDRPGHSLVAPAHKMNLEDYQSALAATQQEWQIDEKHDNDCKVCRQFGIP